MSHYWWIHCDKCGDCSEEYNKAKDELVSAVENIHLLVDAKNSWAWDLDGVKTGGRYLEMIAKFLLAHFDCEDFYVVSEYGKDKIQVKTSRPPSDRIEYLERRVQEQREEIQRLRNKP